MADLTPARASNGGARDVSRPANEVPPDASAASTGDTPANDAYVIDAQSVSRRFDGTEVLRDLSFRIRSGERVALIGPSGAGKTTLLRMMTGVLWPTAGSLHVLGEDVARLRGARLRAFRARVGMLHQSDNLVPGLRVAHNVLMGRLARWSLPRAAWSLLFPRELPLARAALEEVELQVKLWSLPGALSGGQQQRVAIARLLVQAPELTLADEPVSSLDIRLGRDVIDRLARAATRSGGTLLVSLHSLDLLDEHFGRVLALRDGRLHWDGRPADLSRDLLHDIYGAEYRTLSLDEIELRGS